MVDVLAQNSAPELALRAAMRTPLPLPPRKAVDVWILPLDPFAAKGLLPILERAERDIVVGDPARSGARVATRIMLARYCGASPVQLRFASGPFGKPELVDARLSFSLSRRGNLALLAVATKGRLGVDIEMRRPLPELEAIAAMLHRAEREKLARTPESEREDCFFRIWTRKEAALKALGTGLANGLDEFCVTRDRISRPPLALHDLAIGRGCFAAIATEPFVENVRLLAMGSAATAREVRR